MPVGGLILDHRGEVLSSPKTRRAAAAKRLQARFDAAQSTNENVRHWANADFMGPNSELDPGTRRILRSRSRYECANNTYAAGMVRTLANDTIGTGPALHITDGRYSEDEATSIETDNWNWCQAVRLPQKLRLMRMAKARDGESFAQIFDNPRIRHEVKLDFSPFEADMVAHTMFDTTLMNLLDGLFIDDLGNVTAYNVLHDHPGESLPSNDMRADVIPARDIIHLFHANRPGAYRGVPEIMPALPLFALLRDYSLAVVRSAQSAASFSWFLKTQQPPSDMQYGDAWETLDTERGMGMVLPEGYEPQQLKAEQPTDTYPAFKREIISEIARCLNLPYNIAAGDSSSYNYSSGRLDNRNWFKTRGVERSDIEFTALEVLFARWWAVRNDDDPPAHEWRWDGDEHVDPTKESGAAVERCTFGLSARADEVAKLGGDIDVVDRKNAESLGLTLEEYRARLADKMFGAQVKSASDPNADQPAAPFGGAGNG